MSGKKFLTPEVWGKKFFSNLITRTPSQKSNGQPLRGWETKQIWHLSKWHSSTKWLARGHHVVVFKFCILKRHKWKGKVQNNAQFPFYGHKKGFCHEIVCRGIQPCFLHGEVFEETSGTFCTLWSRKVVKRVFFVFIKFSWTFSTFWHTCERKTTKCAPIWNWFYVEFCHVLSRFNLGERIGIRRSS